MKKQFDLTKFETLENTTNDTLKGGFSEIFFAVGGSIDSINAISPIEDSNTNCGHANCASGCGSPS